MLFEKKTLKNFFSSLVQPTYLPGLSNSFKFTLKYVEC